MVVKILVTGRLGQLARSLADRPLAGGLELVFVGRPELNLEAPNCIDRVIRWVAPNIVISAAAWTAVDQAEDEPERAFLANAEAPGRLALAAKAVGARIIHVSTDYVFDGAKEAPYVEADPINPQSVYGRTKAEGEARVRAEHDEHLILRTAWVYSPFGKNFVQTMLTAAATRDRLAVVDDQHGSPTSALDLADGILTIVERWRGGGNTGLGETYHCAGAGDTTWCGFARQIFEASRRMGGPFAEVTAISTNEWPTRAVRPMNSRLDCSKFAADFGYQAPDWRQSVETVVARLVASPTGAPT
jgi:dTDP-4-dehydrorhamnose reductase